MFERYTDTSRRAVFFARHAAVQSGSREIAAHHLLLGLLYDPNPRFNELFHLRQKAEEIRAAIEKQCPTKQPLTIVDIPLDNPAKRVLAYSAEEAKRLNHPSINPEHLLLGLLRENAPVTASVLEQFGVELEAARKSVSSIIPDPPPQLDPIQLFLRRHDTVSLPACMLLVVLAFMCGIWAAMALLW